MRWRADPVLDQLHDGTEPAETAQRAADAETEAALDRFSDFYDPYQLAGPACDQAGSARGPFPGPVAAPVSPMGGSDQPSTGTRP